MPSFDVSSKVNLQELDNALNQTRKELETRYDLKQTKSEVREGEKKGTELILISDSDFTLKQVADVLTGKMVKRGIPLENVKFEKIEPGPEGRVKQTVKIQQGIPVEKAKEVVKIVKDSKIKVQASIQGDEVRVSGKSRDDLQETIALLKQQKLGLALMFGNFRE
ncbi:MAG: YajQ family cyclic di-GMP-binding protein [Bdellovibrionota bacterium]